MFCRGYEVESWSRFWTRFWILSLVEMLMFGWNFEVDAWSRFWRWNLTKICVWTCDMISTLGSVVPLAMFMDDPLNGHCIFFLRSLPFSSSDRYLLCGRFKNEISALLPNRLGWVDVHQRSSPVGRYPWVERCMSWQGTPPEPCFLHQHTNLLPRTSHSPGWSWLKAITAYLNWKLQSLLSCVTLRLSIIVNNVT